MSDFITLGDCTYRPETDTQRGPQWRRLANGDHIDITFTNDPEWTIPEWQALALALDEIVRLRAEVAEDDGVIRLLRRQRDEAEAERDALRALADQLAEALLSGPFRGDRRERMYGSDWGAVHEALDAYEQHKETP